MKKGKLGVKFILDLLMIVVFVLLLYKSNFGMEFHEIAGLAILAAFVFHVLLNLKWVVSISKNLFNGKVKLSAKIGWIVDAALLVSFTLIGISGICMSKVVFHFNINGNWQTLHYFCSALAIILLGVHLGMHFDMIGSVLKCRMHMGNRLFHGISICMICLFIVLGCYSLIATSFTRWITMPFNTHGYVDEVRTGGQGELRKNFARGKKPKHNSESMDGQSKDEGSHRKHAGQNGDIGSRNGMSHMGSMQTSVNPLSIMWRSLQMFSIVFLFASITYFFKIRKGLLKSKLDSA